MQQIADELRTELSREPDTRVQQLIDLDEELMLSISQFTASLSPVQKSQWLLVQQHVDRLRDYARMAKMRLLCRDDAVLPERLESLKSSVDVVDPADMAAIDVGRDMHQIKGVSDIFKALLMWKDTPEEKMAKRE